MFEEILQRLQILEKENVELRAENALLRKENAELRAENARLQTMLNKNSSNSSKPPGSDGFKKKPVSLRGKSGRSSGGQKGHPGQTLQKSNRPDNIVVHTVEECGNCLASLQAVAAAGFSDRQVFDIPPLKIHVTEHRAEFKICPDCAAKTEALFPKGVGQPVQYGPNIKAIIVYLLHYQLVPYERLRELVNDLFGATFSEGTIANVVSACSDNLTDFDNRVVDLLSQSKVAHFDESGVRVKKILHWLHTSGTDKLTHYLIHPKRGGEAIDCANILPRFTGRAVHDHWKPYFKYDCLHALCNAHHLRELKGISENTGQIWPGLMSQLLCEIKKAVESRELHQDEISGFEQKYAEVVRAGFQEIYSKTTAGQSNDAKNLLYRLILFEEETLAFMHDRNVPFDNNLAERDIRMIKVKQKISGCFRSLEGAQDFAKIRSYISTTKKQGLGILTTLRDAILGKPFMPACA